MRWLAATFSHRERKVESRKQHESIATSTKLSPGLKPTKMADRFPSLDDFDSGGSALRAQAIETTSFAVSLTCL